MMFCISARELPLYWERVPSFCNCNPHLMQFELLDDYSEERWNQLLRFSDFHKLNRRISDPDNANCSNYNHIIQTYGIKAEEQ